MISINTNVVNRILIASCLLSLLFVLFFFVWLNYLAGKTDTLGIKPMIYEKKIPPEVLPLSTIHYSDKNIFDISGVQWTIPEIKKPLKTINTTVSIPQQKDIQGIMVLPSVSGVFTKDGFFSVGNKIKGASIKRVENDKIIFSTSDG